LLNLLSLEALPQRFSADLGGLTKKGFYFNEIKGDFKLINGDAYTNNTDIDGTVARILMRGNIGLVAQDYNLILTIIPNVTSSLPIVATVVSTPIVGPAAPLVGAAAFAADQLFRYTVQPLIAYKYQITGSWKHPQVKKLTKVAVAKQ
jgi:uncharacterized protein YhdP